MRSFPRSDVVAEVDSHGNAACLVGQYRHIVLVVYTLVDRKPVQLFQ